MQMYAGLGLCLLKELACFPDGPMQQMRRTALSISCPAMYTCANASVSLLHLHQSPELHRSSTDKSSQ